MNRAEAVERAKQRIRNKLSKTKGEITKTELRTSMPSVRGEHYQEAFTGLIESHEIITEQRSIHSVKHGIPATFVRLAGSPVADGDLLA